MTKDGNAWSFKGEPEGAGGWWGEATYKITNCVLEETTVTREKDNAPTRAAWGILTPDPNVGFVTHNNVGYMWNATRIKPNEQCLLETVQRGEGILWVTKDTSPQRVVDRANQMEFTVAANKSWNCYGVRAREVLNMPGAMMMLTFINDKGINVSDALTQQDIGAHLQYMENTFTDVANAIAYETKLLECQIRVLKRHLVIATAKNDGILAAEQMGLPKCHTVEGAGQFATVWRCEATMTTSETRNSSCGAFLETATHMTMARNG